MGAALASVFPDLANRSKVATKRTVSVKIFRSVTLPHFRVNTLMPSFDR